MSDAQAGLTSGSGTAGDATVVVGAVANAGVAAGTGAAYDGGQDAKPTIGVAEGFGFTRDAFVSVIDASTPYDPAAPDVPMVVHITVGGVDVTGDVLFETARFKSQVNGAPGEAEMRVRDLDSSYSFTEGDEWLLTINGDAVWRGFVIQINRTYIYPAGDVSVSGLQRWWDLKGTDLNILFTRRVVFKKSDPTVVEGKQFPAGTADTAAITELFNNWLDLSSDDLDLLGGITGVGDLDPAQKTRAWSGGWYWGDAMNSIAMLPAAIYYIRPEVSSPVGTVVYCDTDSPTAPFGLSDTPDGTTTKGYREMEVLLDGTSLANDVMAWGMGYGSQTPVFVRDEDSTSQTNHGLWQTGQVTSGVYKQSTINRIADSILNGSPDHHRGAKDDRPAVTLVTYQPGLLAGHVVDFESNVWSWFDTIPVRQMEVTFESPTAPRYELLLSHEIDAPWGFIDQFWRKIPFPNVKPPPPPPPPPPPSECDCGITDTFDRTVASGWGVSDYGVAWEDNNGTSATASVSGYGILATAAGVGYAQQDLYLSIDDEFDLTFEFYHEAFPTGGTTPWWAILITTLSGYEFHLNIDATSSSSYIQANGDSYSYISGFTPSTGTWYKCRFARDSTTLMAKLWELSSSEPPSWTITTSADAPYAFTGAHREAQLYLGSGDGAAEVWFRNLDITDITRCTAVQFDDFERIVASGWGDSHAERLYVDLL